MGSLGRRGVGEAGIEGGIMRAGKTGSKLFAYAWQ